MDQCSAVCPHRVASDQQHISYARLCNDAMCILLHCEEQCAVTNTSSIFPSAICDSPRFISGVLHRSGDGRVAASNSAAGGDTVTVEGSLSIVFQ